MIYAQMVVSATNMCTMFRHDLGSSVTEADNSSRGKVFCKMTAGWSCVITRTEGPDAGKTFVKCGGDCTCMVCVNYSLIIIIIKRVFLINYSIKV